MNQPTRAKSTLELLLTITEWQSKCLDCDFSTHLNVVFPSFFLFPTLVSPKLILCMLMWVFTVCIPYSESRPLQHLPAYQIRCMLICQYMLWLHNKKTPTDSSGAGAFCMHSPCMILLHSLGSWGETEQLKDIKWKLLFLLAFDWRYLILTKIYTLTSIQTYFLTYMETHFAWRHICWTGDMYSDMHDNTYGDFNMPTHVVQNTS